MKKYKIKSPENKEFLFIVLLRLAGHSLYLFFRRFLYVNKEKYSQKQFLKWLQQNGIAEKYSVKGSVKQGFLNEDWIDKDPFYVDIWDLWELWKYKVDKGEIK